MIRAPLSILLVTVALSLMPATLIVGASPTSSASAAPSAPPGPILAGIALGAGGRVYVTDIKKGRVYVLSPNLRPLATWKIPKPAGPFDVHLAGVTVTPHGAIFVSDLDDRIMKLSPMGRVLGVWGSPGRGPGDFSQPWGIATDRRGHIVVADGYNHRLQMLSAGGRFIAHWQLYPRNEWPGGPCGLQYVAVGPAGRIFVSDDCFGRILVVSATGRLLHIWYMSGSARDQYAPVGGVAVGPRGNVFAGGAGVIEKFSPAGKVLARFHRAGLHPWQPFSPAGIAVSRRGDIYAADPESCRVFKLSPAGKTLAVRRL
ncbi:MAG: NHL repeat-containing protein [Chloroflexota bacterium]